jgi:hypothetical protein
MHLSKDCLHVIEDLCILKGVQSVELLICFKHLEHESRMSEHGGSRSPSTPSR